MKAMNALGISTFVEPGPGDVLSKLAKRAVPGVTAVPVGSPDDAAAFARTYAEEGGA
jgi:[acyl-carrier-protein] S-malonyltransferase